MTFQIDDIGSFPLPEGASRDRLREIAEKIIEGSFTEEEEDEFIAVAVKMFSAKIDAGIEVPNYPQLHEMIDGFMKPIEKFCVDGEPHLIKSEYAIIPEVEVVKVYAERLFEEGGEKTNLRVCVTGPLDLYVRSISTQVEGDLFASIGKSVGSFIENSILDEDYIKTTSVSLDEPSLGLNPNIIVSPDDLVSAWDHATKHVTNQDVQIHLHAPAEAEHVYQTKKINVIGVETAENPSHLKAFDKKTLEEHDRYLRVGIARSNITALSSDFEQKHGVNPMNDAAALSSMIDEFESPKIIRSRLDKARKIFDDRIKYVGPDCGLGLWPSIKSASKLLENTVKAVRD